MSYRYSCSRMTWISPGARGRGSSSYSISFSLSMVLLYPYHLRLCTELATFAASSRVGQMSFKHWTRSLWTGSPHAIDDCQLGMSSRMNNIPGAIRTLSFTFHAPVPNHSFQASAPPRERNPDCATFPLSSSTSHERSSLLCIMSDFVSKEHDAAEAPVSSFLRSVVEVEVVDGSVEVSGIF